MRRSQILITLFVALALIAAPVAASTLDHEGAPRLQPHPAQVSRAPWATLLTPPLAPGIPPVSGGVTSDAVPGDASGSIRQFVSDYKHQHERTDSTFVDEEF
ncbi:MAG TPA: hypothetical protein VLK58_01145, partial [Conexibacter sp.]|nr:hypothetical protein [Conexibacter sp.]